MPGISAVFKKLDSENVAAILQTPENEIRTHLQRRLESFPEKRILRKYVRFRHEYDLRFAGEAEDRNRYYFWTISPFFAYVDSTTRWYALLGEKQTAAHPGRHG